MKNGEFSRFCRVDFCDADPRVIFLRGVVLDLHSGIGFNALCMHKNGDERESKFDVRELEFVAEMQADAFSRCWRKMMQHHTLIGVICTWILFSVTTAQAQAPSKEQDLLGTWYLLVHYQDRTSQSPERWHWEDRIWVIEDERAALRWRDYPIVIFKDESGRFEKSRGGLQRALGAWVPSEGQEREIRKGLRVNERGARSKRLEAAPTQDAAPASTLPKAGAAEVAPDATHSAPPGAPDFSLNGEDLADSHLRWASAVSEGGSSALVITYTENWSIRESSPKHFPVFVWTAALESGIGEGVEDSTIFVVEEKFSDGSEYRGRYQKDGNFVGRFSMRRSGSISLLGD